MSDQEVTLGQLFSVPLDQESAGGSGSRTAEGMTKFKERLKAEVKTIHWPASMPDLVEKVTQLLDIPLPDIMIEAWRKSEEIEEALEESRKSPQDDAVCRTRGAHTFDGIPTEDRDPYRQDACEDHRVSRGSLADPEGGRATYTGWRSSCNQGGLVRGRGDDEVPGTDDRREKAGHTPSPGSNACRSFVRISDRSQGNHSNPGEAQEKDLLRATAEMKSRHFMKEHVEWRPRL